MVTRFAWLGLLLLSSSAPGLACSWYLVQDEAGVFEAVNRTGQKEDYFYAAVVPFEKSVATLNDLAVRGMPLDRSAERGHYRMPQALRHGMVYLISSPTRLILNDQFRIIPVFDASRSTPETPAVPWPYKGMKPDGGPLLSPKAIAPEGEWPQGIDVCARQW
jgi:hypothetical protein